MRWLWARKALCPEEQAITDSLKALKTLRVKDGRVSVDAEEVIGRPGYLQARRQAAVLASSQAALRDKPCRDWKAVNEIGMEHWLSLVAIALRRSRSEGVAYLDAIENLKYMRLKGVSMNELENAVSALTSGEGAAMSGFTGSEAQAEAEAILTFNGKPYCLVRDWTVVDVCVSDAYRNDLAQDRLLPCVLYASDVVCHSAGVRHRGDWVRSTFLRELDGYRFETRNTSYLLIGPGCRKTASAELVLAMTS